MVTQPVGSGQLRQLKELFYRKDFGPPMRKRLGQRWSKDGVQNMITLRVGVLSYKWEKVINANTRMAA
jgi:hypothetical protein